MVLSSYHLPLTTLLPLLPMKVALKCVLVKLFPVYALIRSYPLRPALQPVDMWCPNVRQRARFFHIVSPLCIVANVYIYVDSQNKKKEKRQNAQEYVLFIRIGWRM
jgi:hypothetical protein